jgi:putative tryptophan/tyrosine transport system substrate-binding protein
MAVAVPFTARTQQATVRVIGVLSPESATKSEVEGLRAGLRELGYVEGRNVRFEYRWRREASSDFPT